MNVLFINLDSNPCLEGNCKLFPDLINKTLPENNISFRLTTAIPGSLEPPLPDLVVLRPRQTQSLSDILTPIRRKWNQPYVLGLFCEKFLYHHEEIRSPLDDLDDFIVCPFGGFELTARMQRFFKRNGKGKRTNSLAKGITERFRPGSLIGKSKSFLASLEKIPRLADSDAPVMIYGETGTGKDLFAKAIHYRGLRSGKPFVPVNCGALPEHLFENELFGHAKGAYTDASTSEKGLIAEAEGGTLFLDEIDTLSPRSQIKLLRFLQDREYRPLGSSMSRAADVRVIAATNADLKKQGRKKFFREDLYYRLNVLSFAIPPLRERLEDVPLLAAHFLLRFGREKGLCFSQEALQKLMAYPWPGNVRELEGVIQRAVILGTSPIFQSEDIAIDSFYSQERSKPLSLHESKTRLISRFESAYLKDLLIKHRGNITRASRAAGKERRAFRRLLQKHNLERKAFQV